MEEINGWVICVNCGQRYYREKYTKKTNSCCPACRSKEFEPDEDAADEGGLDEYMDTEY